MKDLWNATVAGVKGWKLVWAKALLTTLVAGTTVFTASMQGIEWDMLTGTQRFVILTGIFTAMCNNLIAFLSETMKDIEDASEKKVKLQ